MKTCPNCKAEFDDSKFYCNKCGSLLISEQINTVQKQNSQVVGTVSPNKAPQRVQKKEISDLTAGIIIAIGIILVRVIGAIRTVFYTGRFPLILR